jgi:hypothetical protein
MLAGAWRIFFGETGRGSPFFSLDPRYSIERAG